MLKNLFIVGGGNFINSIFGFLFLTAAARTLPESDFGLYALIIATFMLLAKMTELGTTSSFVTVSIRDLKDYSRPLLFLKTVQTASTLALSIPILAAYGSLTLGIFLTFGMGLVGYAANDFIFAIFQLREDFIKTTFVNFLPAFFKGVFAALLLAHLISPSLLVTFALYFSALLSSLLMLPLIKPRYSDRADVLSGALELARKGFLGGISQTLSLGTPAINTGILKVLTSLSDIGIFELAEKISSIFVVAYLSLFTVFLPKSAKDEKSSGTYNIKQALALCGLLIAPIIIMLLVSRQVITFVYGDRYLASIPILNVMTVAAGILAIISFMDHYFFIKERTKTLIAISLFRVMLLILLGSAATAWGGAYKLALVNVAVCLIVLALTLLVVVWGRKKKFSESFLPDTQT